MCDDTCENTKEEKRKDVVVLEPGTTEATVNMACCSGAKVRL